MCYQWSADPRRPNPLQNPQGWYRYWMTVLRSTYSRPIVCIVKDSEPKQHSQGVFQRLRTFRTGVYRDAQTIAKLYAQFKPIIEGSWAHKSPRERADILMQALIELAAPLGPEELWKYCPDITRSLLCGGTGEGFLRMMKHFVMSSISHTPSNFSVLSHPDVWSRFDFSSDDAERPKHVRTIHETVLVLRHAFITQVIMRMAYSLAGIQTKPMFTRQPRIRTLDRQTHQALQQPAFKDKNKQRKIFEAFADAGWAHYVDFCEHCGKSGATTFFADGTALRQCKFSAGKRF
ncbi:hypothetical protein PLICRDRAFT_36396 [Plicaturopsis crispa FD-325 SS-3]|nr:hypothetical protein PLICRDRAFT_36396 [Plicaturopsis crispa FD-325 SS-3]